MSLKNTLLIALTALFFVSVQTPLDAKNAAVVDTVIVIEPLPGGSMGANLMSNYFVL